MEKKFRDVALTANHPSWDKLIKREDEIYDRKDDIRSPFARDYTRILHSLAYRRLKHKTQVFFNAAGNDHICTRIEHVSHVESVANTIANYLGLNEELTKAIAMAHDLGHAPFGHLGETIINELTKKYLSESFWHEKNGVYFVDSVELLEDYEKNYRNLNLTYAVRDGIISHCGEVDQNGIKPRKDFCDLDEFKIPGQHQAATWEGCVVKLSDKIAYLGRDIEDAIRLDYIKPAQLEELRDVAEIGEKKAINTTVIMHDMIIDLCENSSVEKGLCLSDKSFKQLNLIKEFNYNYIYKNKRLEPYSKYSRLIIEELFNELKGLYQGKDTVKYIEKIDFNKRKFVKGFATWLVQYIEVDESYPDWAIEIAKHCYNKKIYNNLEDEKVYIRAVIDFLSGMTDVYAINSFEELLEC